MCHGRRGRGPSIQPLPLDPDDSPPREVTNIGPILGECRAGADIHPKSDRFSPVRGHGMIDGWTAPGVQLLRSRRGDHPRINPLPDFSTCRRGTALLRNAKGQ